ncbi:DMT family transporter [Oceanibacterium hippocampi]|uniref:Putative inner membrane transporter yiJE n=1 Tax=Oceanibacterium hippocampi TaxID=745714 RepID=A0A1Y5RI93_9PROT|nr:DMT family transporter [Oceanibacterium hippocampi]SLN18213.1 putative inner membrane transporter yiJE [Oceanibacterium hippocampi]
MEPPSPRDWVLLVTLSVLWGGAFVFTGIVVTELPVFTTVMLRSGIAVLPLLLMLGRDGRAALRAHWPAFLVMGFLNGLLPHTLIVFGQQSIEAGTAAILNGMAPLFSVFLAPLFATGERLTANRIAGVSLGICGVAVLVGGGPSFELGPKLIGEFAVLGGALTYAFAAIYARRFRGIKPVVVAGGQLGMTALLALPLALAFEAPWRLAPGPDVIGAMLVLALVSTSVGYLIYFHLLGRTGATNALLVTLLIPVSALIIAAILIGERPGPESYLGMVLVIGGIATVDGRVFRLLRSRRPLPGGD